MFTGIIEATGKIEVAEQRGSDARVLIATDLNLDDAKLGDSISVNGVCLTVVDLSSKRISVDDSAETLNVTTGFVVGEEVNLEKALRLSDRLGGHMVSGHVDGIGLIKTLTSRGESYTLSLEVPRPLLRYIAPKGSITINGVSLTVNKIESNHIFINLIPHTWVTTAFKSLKEGDKVNVEIDMLARYVGNLINYKE